MWAASAVSAQTDTEAPSVPVNLAGTAFSSTAVVLYWTQSEVNVGATGYDIHRDGVFITTHTDNTFTDTGLTPGAEHSYQVSARDAAGNVSALSSAVTVATDATENPRLIRPEHLSYLGAFRFPSDAQTTTPTAAPVSLQSANDSLSRRGPRLVPARRRDL